MENKIDSFMLFMVRNFYIYLSDKAAEITFEKDPEKRKFLYDEYFDLEQIYHLYMDQLENGKKKFDWKYLFRNEKLSLYCLGHFKSELLENDISEDEWQKEVEKSYQYMGKETVEKYLKKCEKYIKKHKELKNESETTNSKIAEV